MVFIDEQALYIFQLHQLAMYDRIIVHLIYPRIVNGKPEQKKKWKAMIKRELNWNRIVRYARLFCCENIRSLAQK